MNDLYQENILDHAHNPRNYTLTPNPSNSIPNTVRVGYGEGDHSKCILTGSSPNLGEAGEGYGGCICGEGDNPSCGDEGVMCVNLTPGHSPKESGIVVDVKWSGRGCAISQASMSIMSEYIKGKTIKELKLLMPGDIYAMLGINITPSRVNCALLPYRAVEKIIEKSM